MTACVLVAFAAAWAGVGAATAGESVAEVFDRVARSVVVARTVERELRVEGGRRAVSIAGVGSGVLISADGKILTAAHVVGLADEGHAEFSAVETIHGLSAHADADGLMRWLGTAMRPPRRVFLVPGDPGPADALASRIRKELGWAAAVPRYRDRVPLD